MIKAGLLAASYGANPVSLKRGMERTVKELIEVLKKSSFPVKGSDDIKGTVLFRVQFLLNFNDNSLLLLQF